MRLLTRSDFDGLACGAILKEVGVVESWDFVHPIDIQDGIIKVKKDDVLANTAYIKGCGMWFDHHAPERPIKYEGAAYLADSAARVIYEYYGGLERLPQFEDMVNAADKLASARLTKEEVLCPSGWVLLGFIMDPRTGLGRFHNFRISNYDLMENLMDACCEQGIDEILDNLDVEERAELYFEHRASFTDMLHKYSRVEGDVLITDLRGVSPIYCGNRYMVYLLYPEQNASIWVVDGRAKFNCPLEAGHSIFNKTNGTDIGALMREFGGNGHPRAGTCQVRYEKADEAIATLIQRLNTGK